MSGLIGIEAVRAKWNNEKASWPETIAHAHKRKLLGLSLHSPLEPPDDPYLDYMSDGERHDYIVTINQLNESKAVRARILKPRIEADGAMKEAPITSRESAEYNKAGQICDWRWASRKI
jgi:hypothetical protein